MESLKDELASIVAEGTLFFDSIRQVTETKETYYEQLKTEAYLRFKSDWEFVADAKRENAQAIRAKLTDFGIRLIGAIKQSPLLEQADEASARRLLREMSAALLLKRYSFVSSYVVSERDTVFGIVPEEQQESPQDVQPSARQFQHAADQLLEGMDLLAPSADKLTRAIVSSQIPSVQKYRQNTAFIMMQIDAKLADLEDVKNCIKDVFKDFGITALRSDEIEHADVITQRILDEIATSEFLVADLTGARPSVYYEVGYAHAIGKRPILYRREGTPLHFDLVVHNVPEYRNTTDLRAKLRTRLEAMTNRTPAK